MIGKIFRLGALALILFALAGCGESSSAGGESASGAAAPSRGVEEAKAKREATAQRIREKREGAESEVQSYEEEGE